MASHSRKQQDPTTRTALRLQQDPAPRQPSPLQRNLWAFIYCTQGHGYRRTSRLPYRMGRRVSSFCAVHGAIVPPSLCSGLPWRQVDHGAEGTRNDCHSTHVTIAVELQPQDRGQDLLLQPVRACLAPMGRRLLWRPTISSAHRHYAEHSGYWETTSYLKEVCIGTILHLPACCYFPVLTIPHAARSTAAL